MSAKASTITQDDQRSETGDSTATPRKSKKWLKDAIEDLDVFNRTSERASKIQARKGIAKIFQAARIRQRLTQARKTVGSGNIQIEGRSPSDLEKRKRSKKRPNHHLIVRWKTLKRQKT